MVFSLATKLNCAYVGNQVELAYVVTDSWHTLSLALILCSKKLVPHCKHVLPCA